MTEFFIFSERRHSHYADFSICITNKTKSNVHSKKGWVVLTQFCIKYGQIQMLD